jgi:hypothetical protein
MTPYEELTREYIAYIEELSGQAEKEMESAFKDATKILVFLYLSLPKEQGYSFRFDSSSSPVFEKLRTRLAEIAKKYETKAIDLSGAKNQELFNRVMQTPEMKNWFARKISGRTFSQRIWKYGNMYKMEMEARIAVGIVNGEREVAIISDIMKCLKNPYETLLVETKSDWAARRLAVKFTPAEGTYISGFSNAQRLVRNEIFMAYRRADHEIWKSLKEVVGVRVYLNRAHPKVDMCDDLAGYYPKDFFFPGWHPRCICLSEPITAGEMIREIPSKAREYMADEKTGKYKSLTFYVDNLNYF